MDKLIALIPARWPYAVGGLALVFLVVLVIALMRRKPTQQTGEKSDYLLVFGVALVVTATSAQGMFNFFHDRLRMPEVLVWVLFFVLELSLVVFARQSRRMLRWSLEHNRAHASAGPAGKLVWLVAGLTATLSATDAQGFGAQLFRVGMPLLAVSLWELQLWEERYRARILAGISTPT
ncbi:MAG: hypothetical protein H0W34_04990, partial [Pyrinomonadaceae bacterium]|nr:hypothetical protein [Pyrinomonadaceae bacterium]